MVQVKVSADVREALDELQSYLSDQLPPLMVMDSIGVLLGQPPDVAASGIQAWISGQYRGVGASVPISDYFFHALKKMQLMGEFRLVPQEQLEGFIKNLTLICLNACPPDQRESLRSAVARMGEDGLSTSSASLDYLYRAVSPSAESAVTAGAGAAGVALSQEAERGLRRFALLLGRFSRLGAPEGEEQGGAAPPQVELLSQILSTAVNSSRSNADLEQFLEKLRASGVDTRSDNIFLTLGQGLPGWVLPAGEAGQSAQDAQIAPAAPVEAMHRLISLAGDPQEGAGRFNELVRAAVERFNAGALGPAVTMIDLANDVMGEKSVDREVAERIRQRAHEALSSERLAEFADRPEKRALLRRAMNFFPALSPEGLLKALKEEPKRERRRLQLSLLVAHGAVTREIAFDWLQTRDDEELGHFFQRNLIHLLRRIPRKAEASTEAEVELLARFCEPRRAPIIIREAIAALGQVHTEQAERVLVSKLHECERRLLSEQPPPEAEDIRAALDCLALALARTSTPRVLRALVDHGLSRQPAFGNTLARLEELAGVDLSGDPDTLGKLLKALKAELPVKVLGLVLQKKGEGALRIIRALQGTMVPEVRQAFEEIVRRFPGEEFADAAARALAGPPATQRVAEVAAPAGEWAASTEPRPARPAETVPEGAPPMLTGDLDLFGLPNLLQTLADSSVNGVLTLHDPEGRDFGTLTFEGGRLRDSSCGHLSGEVAFYELFEKPRPGTFVVRNRPGGGDSQPPALELMPLILEGVRRHDEFQMAKALVPDDMKLGPAGVKPTRPEDEPDQELLRFVWARALSGVTPALCEADCRVDCYRVRRMYAHWLEEGALKQR